MGFYKSLKDLKTNYAQMDISESRLFIKIIENIIKNVIIRKKVLICINTLIDTARSTYLIQRNIFGPNLL